MTKEEVTINITLEGKTAKEFLRVKALRQSSGASLAKFAIKKLLNDREYIKSLK